MMRLINAEYIKGRHTFCRISIFLFPLLVAAMAIFLMGGQFTQIGAFNWWYMILLPTLMGMICIDLTGAEKRNGFFNVSVLPIGKGAIWTAKVFTGCSYLLVCNAIVFGLTTISGAIFGAQYPLWQGVAATMVLTIVHLWQIPLWMFVSTKFASVAALLGSLALNMVCGFQDIAGGKLWFIPFAIPARLMAPILGINPNGVPLDAASPLHDTSVIFPGILITAVLFTVMLYMTRQWFDGRSE